MSIKTTTVVLFAVCFAVVSCRPQTGLFDCSGKQDGIHSDPSDDKGYYVCFQEEAITRLQCSDGEVFDKTLNNCVSENEDIDADSLDKEEGVDEELENLKKQVIEKLQGDENPFWEDDRPSNSSYKVYNVQLKSNIFPKSMVIIGQGNREQKNK